MRILGLDPGVATTGYAVIEMRGRIERALDWGVIETKKNLDLPDRLNIIRRDLVKLIKKYDTATAGVESLFFAKNVKTAIAVAHARGVILVTLRQMRVKIVEMTPLQVKSQIASYGMAPKAQVQAMVKKLLGLSEQPRPDDAADALAIALCAAMKQ